MPNDLTMICVECNDETCSDDLICPDCLREISGYEDDLDDDSNDSTDSD